ncbi:hypothetical protein MG296_10965 [Flavobacteriaceae bacterium TK19130]|nr:hypothetical protein [Thermobacterium salinum]
MEKSIFSKIEKALKPDFGNILTKSFDLFKESWVEGMVHVLISLLVVIPFLIIIYVPLIPIMIADARRSSYDYYDYGYGYEYNPFEEYAWPLIVGYFLLIIVFTFFMQVFNYSIYAHFYRVLKQKDVGVQKPIGGYFSMAQKHFGKLLLLSLASVGIALLAALLCYLPLFYVMVPLQLFIVILAFNPELSVSEVIKASFKLGNRFWLIIFGLIIIGGLIAQLGIILCGIGIIATASFVHFPMYYLYKDTVGFDEVPTETDPLITR